MYTNLCEEVRLSSIIRAIIIHNPIYQHRGALLEDSVQRRLGRYVFSCFRISCIGKFAEVRIHNPMLPSPTYTVSAIKERG